MTKTNSILFLIIFILTGEFLIRIDKKFELSIRNTENIISIEIMDSALKMKVDSNDFIFNSNQLRVLVVGDSYIHGSGINPKEKFSNLLQRKLQNVEYAFSEVYVLDVSRPSNNSLDNFLIFQHYINIFKPQIIVWAYNINDVLHIDAKEFSNFQISIENEPKQTEHKIPSLKLMTRKIYNFSELVRFVSSSIQKELKANGIVLPIGEFYDLTNKAYLDESKNWIKSKEIFKSSNEICLANNIDFIFYKIPEFNLLEYDFLFENVNNSLTNFFTNFPSIHYIDGFDDFSESNSESFMISRYDGHPNEKAHEIMADRIGQEINKLQIMNASAIKLLETTSK